jgi:osmotically-inducible protein OsmY
LLIHEGRIEVSKEADVISRSMRMSAIGSLLALSGCGAASSAPTPQGSAQAPLQSLAEAPPRGAHDLPVEPGAIIDRNLEEEIQDRLDRYAYILPSSIAVEVSDSVASIDGIVPSELARQAAQQIAIQPENIRGVASSVVVREIILPDRSDVEIRGEVEKQLRSLPPGYEAESLDVSVLRGRVTLTGEVPSWDAYDDVLVAALRVTPIVEFDIDVPVVVRDEIPEPDDVFGPIPIDTAGVYPDALPVAESPDDETPIEETPVAVAGPEETPAPDSAQTEPWKREEN